MTVYFDTLHLYYLTQYIPVFQELAGRGVKCGFVFYKNEISDATAHKVTEREGLDVVWVKSEQEAAAFYRKEKAEIVIFGNKFTCLDSLDSQTTTVQLYHGIGMKNDVYRPSLMEMDIRFVEGPHYTEALKKLYPEARIEEVGYAKLDPLFGPENKRPVIDYSAAGLDPSRRLILYAPTFYPSSIEMMPDDLPDHFSGFNLIVKPHMFTWSKAKYSAQRKKLGLWEKKSNCYIPDPDEFNLLPFINSADIMISDASSALFEFAATGKPVVWCDFLKLRWTYRGPLRYRFKRRMDATILIYSDIAAHAASFKELAGTVDGQLRNPSQFSRKRKEYTRRLVGEADGLVSVRIADCLMNEFQMSASN